MTASDQPGAPSMDAILASIKRIIAEEAEEAISTQPLRRVTPAAPDVLELTEVAAEPEVAPPPAAADVTSRTDALSAMVVGAQPKGGETLETLVREMLRPMLAEWLDAKLPAMVERLVAAEIGRITARN